MTITGYPTIYLISAQNKKVYRNSGSHPNFQRLQDWILGSFKMEANPGM
jgi:hypothetical protein